MNDKKIDLGLTAYDDLFQTDASREENQQKKVVFLDISEIDNFPQHPFKVIDDDSMKEMVESIKQFGVLQPITVRKKEDGRYELISGHRRKHACEVAGINKIRAIVEDMSIDEATVAMVDSNLQRERILPSEKAFAYKMRLEAMKRQGKRNDLTSDPVGPKLRSNEKLAEQIGESAMQIKRYIRLTELITPLLDLVDEGKIAMRPAVELSYLPKDHQEILFDTIQFTDCTPSQAQAIKLRKFSENQQLNKDVIISILEEEKPNQKQQIKIPQERIKKYFPAGTPAEKIQEDIIKGLELLHRKRERDTER